MTNPVSSLRILPAEIGPQQPAEDGDFVDTLRVAMDQVEQLHDTAQNQVAALLQGGGMDVHSAMIAVEKADLSFQLMVQVRNKIVAAYQEISRMQF